MFNSEHLELAKRYCAGLNDFEQKQDDHDGQDKAEPTAAVVPKPGPHAVAAKAEHQNQDDKNDKHLHLQGE
jgi:hypothetical protein